MQTAIVRPENQLHREGMTSAGQRILQALFALYAVVYALLQLYWYYDRSIAEPLMLYYMAPLCFAFSGISIAHPSFRRRPEGMLVIAFCLWHLLVEITAGAFSFMQPSQQVYHVLFVFLVCLPLASDILSPRARRLTLSVVFHLFTVAVMAFCVIALYHVFTQTLSYSRTGFAIGLANFNLYRLYVWMYPNTISTLATILLLLCVYMVITKRPIWLRIVDGLFALIFYGVIALTDSRTSMVATAAGIGCLAFVFVHQWVKRGRALPFVAGCLAAVAAAGICLAGFTLPVRATQGILNAKASAETPWVSAAKAEAATPAEEDKPAIVTQTRGLDDELTSFNGRTDAWRAALEALRDQPRILLTGVSADGIEPLIANYVDVLFEHLHNAFLQILMAMGLPGLCLFLAFLACVLIKSLRLFFSNDPSVSLGTRFLPAVLFASLLIALVEAQFVITFQYLYDPVLACVSGYIIAEAGQKAKKSAGDKPQRLESIKMVSATHPD